MITNGAGFGTRSDWWLTKLKGYGPYGTSLAYAAMGLAMYKVGGPSTALGLCLQVLGALLCLFCVVSVYLWHFLQWPKWFGKASQSSRGRGP
jgi:hypothetical protein